MARRRVPDGYEHFNILEHDDENIMLYVKNVIQGREKNIDKYHNQFRHPGIGELFSWTIKTSTEHGEPNVKISLRYQRGKTYDFERLLKDLVSQLGNVFDANKHISYINSSGKAGVLVGYSDNHYWVAVMDTKGKSVNMYLYRCSDKRQVMEKIPKDLRVSIETRWGSLAVSFLQKARSMLYCMDAIQGPEEGIQKTSALCICARCNKVIW